MPYTATTQVEAFSVSILLDPGTPAEVAQAVGLIARGAARRLGHAAAEARVVDRSGRPAVVIDGLVPAKGMHVTAAALRQAIDGYLAGCP